MYLHIPVHVNVHTAYAAVLLHVLYIYLMCRILLCVCVDVRRGGRR